MSIFLAFDEEGGEVGKFGCDIDDFSETLLTPLMDRILKAEELKGMVSLSIEEQEIFARAELDKSTIAKMKSREKLFLDGSIVLKIDEFEFDLSFKGPLNPSNPFADSYPPTVKVCFGKPEICDNITPDSGSSFGPMRFLTELLIEKEARIVVDEFEVKLSINGDLRKTFNKIMRDEIFQADLKAHVDSNESFARIDYQAQYIY